MASEHTIARLARRRKEIARTGMYKDEKYVCVFPACPAAIL
jgi:hypothetical protein